MDQLWKKNNYCIYINLSPLWVSSAPSTYHNQFNTCILKKKKKEIAVCGAYKANFYSVWTTGILIICVCFFDWANAPWCFTANSNQLPRFHFRCWIAWLYYSTLMFCECESYFISFYFVNFFGTEMGPEMLTFPGWSSLSFVSQWQLYRPLQQTLPQLFRGITSADPFQCSVATW